MKANTVTTIKCLSALDAKELPTRLLILKWGANPNVKGFAIVVNERTAEQMPKLNAKLGLDRTVIDFEHNTVEGSPAYERESEPRKVAAYCTPVVVPGEGIWLEDIQWTPEGLENAHNYADMSAAVKTARDGTVLVYLSGALCRNGATEGIHFLSAAGAGMDAELDAEATQTPNEEEVKAMEDLKKMFDELVERIAALEAQLKGVPAPVDEKALMDAAVATCSANVQTELAKLEKSWVMRQAAAEGKVITLSAEAVEKLSVKDLEDHVKTLSASVPMKPRTTPRQPAGAGEGLMAQYNAIEDPIARSQFFKAHSKELAG